MHAQKALASLGKWLDGIHLISITRLLLLKKKNKRNTTTLRREFQKRRLHVITIYYQETVGVKNQHTERNEVHVLELQHC